MKYISHKLFLLQSILNVSKLHSNILNTIGLNIRKLRMVKGLSQSQLGFEAGLTREYINKVEAGTNNISILKLEQIATVLDVSVSTFLSE